MTKILLVFALVVAPSLIALADQTTGSGGAAEGKRVVRANRASELGTKILAQATPQELAPISLSINGVLLTGAEIQAIENQYGVRLVGGRYWYDRHCGAWGIEGGATMGWVMPGLSVGGPLQAGASGGHTNVFINGRELHYLDVVGLQQFLQVLPGRYWVDARWNCGYEGGPPLFNLATLMSAQASASRGAWSTTTKNKTTVGGDGGGFMYVSGKDSSGNSYTYFP